MHLFCEEGSQLWAFISQACFGKNTKFLCSLDNDPFLIQMDMDMNDAGLDFPPKVGIWVGLALGYETRAWQYSQ